MNRKKGIVPWSSLNLETAETVTKFRAKFVGRKRCAIGKVYRFSVVVEAKDEETARLKLYDDYEHISDLKISLAR